MADTPPLPEPLTRAQVAEALQSGGLLDAVAVALARAGLPSIDEMELEDDHRLLFSGDVETQDAGGTVTRGWGFVLTVEEVVEL